MGARGGDHRLRVDANRGDPARTIRGDRCTFGLLLKIEPVLFEQVLINLIENATKHAAPPFAIRARRRGEDVEIEVADRGPGVPAGDTAHLFDKFVRASAAPGAGLGLAVVRAIVQAHGGTVSAENQPGGGAVFRVILPTPAAPALPGQVAS